jgi:hypothetical protein
MAQKPLIEVPKWALMLLNNLYEIEKKLTIHGDSGNASRNVEKIKDILAGEQLFYEDPINQVFKETRTDLEATISGESTENLIVTEVVKPIIRYGNDQYSKVVQKGIVVVESADNRSIQ